MTLANTIATIMLAATSLVTSIGTFIAVLSTRKKVTAVHKDTQTIVNGKGGDTDDGSLSGLSKHA